MNEELYNTSLSPILKTANTTLDDLKVYILSLSEFDALKLSFSFEEIKSAHKKYRSFLSGLLKQVDSLEHEVANIARLMNKLDKADDIDGIKRLSNIFESYISWKKAVNEFIMKSDDIFKNKGEKFKLSLNLIYTRSFISATENFISELEK